MRTNASVMSVVLDTERTAGANCSLSPSESICFVLSLRDLRMQWDMRATRKHRLYGVCFAKVTILCPFQRTADWSFHRLSGKSINVKICEKCSCKNYIKRKRNYLAILFILGTTPKINELNPNSEDEGIFPQAEQDVWQTWVVCWLQKLTVMFLIYFSPTGT